MKITTAITVTVLRHDGSQAMVASTSIKDVGDNPAFERQEAKIALTEATSAFIETKGLGGTRPL